MSNDAIQEIELNISEAKKVVELGASLERLRNNRDFKKVIQEGYFQQEAIRLVHLKSDYSFQTPERQKSILTQIDAIGNLNQYFETVFHQASLARKAIEADEYTRDEILAEGAE
jgi:CHAT domain-containing protein